jgi:hypothetical protein
MMKLLFSISLAVLIGLAPAVGRAGTELPTARPVGLDALFHLPALLQQIAGQPSASPLRGELHLADPQAIFSTAIKIKGQGVYGCLEVRF